MNVLVVGRAKTGTTVIAKTIQNNIPDSELLMEPNAVGQFFAKYQASVVAKIIFEHWSDRHYTRLAILNNEFALKFDKHVAIIRDPRDELISRIFYIVYGYIKNGRLGMADIQPWVEIVKKKERAPGEVSVVELLSVLNNVLGTHVSLKISDTFEYYRFLRKHYASAHLLRYEDFVSGRLHGLEDYLGFPLNAENDLGKRYSRLFRTADYNNWKGFFLKSDLDEFRQCHEEDMQHIGYADWELTPVNALNPEHGSLYLDRLCADALAKKDKAMNTPSEERSHRQMSSGHGDGIALAPCNICGGTEFGHGPNGRKASTGVPPRCMKCDSLERHRVLRKILQGLPIGFLEWRKVLQFSHDQGLDRQFFPHLELSIFEGENSLDLQVIDRPEESYDFISLNHVLESVPDDRAAFSELCRILSPKGILQICFGSPLSRDKTVDLPEPMYDWKAYHLYGVDLVERFRCKENGVYPLVIEETDPCTHVRQVVHLFLKDAEDAMRIRAWLSGWSNTIKMG